MKNEEQEDKYMDYRDYPIMYGPSTGKQLKKMYPELAAEPLFKDLTNEDILFAWYLGNKSSPVDPNWTDEVRYKQSALQAYQNNAEKRNAYGMKQVPEAILIAVEKMATFSPNARMTAKRTIQNHFHNILKMSNVDVDKDFKYIDKDGNELTDWTARNQYVTSIKTTAEIVPTLIRQMEEGFGIEKRKVEEEGGMKQIDKYHQDKKNKS